MNIVVNTADFVVDAAPNVLSTHGVGSCVVVCLFCRPLALGALGHFMLPKAPATYLSGFKYVDKSLDAMMDALLKRGVSKRNLEVSLIGGAQMFKVLESSVMNIGQRNVEEARQWFQRNGLLITLQDVGGNVGRNVAFDLDTGVVSIAKSG